MGWIISGAFFWAHIPSLVQNYTKITASIGWQQAPLSLSLSLSQVKIRTVSWHFCSSVVYEPQLSLLSQKSSAGARLLRSHSPPHSQASETSNTCKDVETRRTCVFVEFHQAAPGSGSHSSNHTCSRFKHEAKLMDSNEELFFLLFYFRWGDFKPKRFRRKHQQLFTTYFKFRFLHCSFFVIQHVEIHTAKFDCDFMCTSWILCSNF